MALNHVHVERVIDILREKLTPAEIGVWMHMKFDELGGGSPVALLAAGDVGSVVRLANSTVKRDVKAAPVGRPGEPLAQQATP